MSEKRLQRKKDGDLHELQLDDSTMREVQRSLKTAGIDYRASDSTDQGQFILHFAGRDEDHIRAAVQRAFRNMGLDVADELHRRTTNGAAGTDDGTDQSEPETPAQGCARRTGGEAHADTWRIAWDFVDPEVMEMAANSLAARHPELSWDRLARRRHGTSRPAATSRTGSSARPPPTDIARRARHHPADDYGQGAQTQEQTRGRTAEPSRETPATGAGKPAGTHGRNPVEGPATADAAQNQRSQAGRQEQKPKPIRSKKALLERFKTRLNENLTEQKNHMPPTQNRDRTPRRAAERKPQ